MNVSKHLIGAYKAVAAEGEVVVGVVVVEAKAAGAPMACYSTE